MCISSLLCFAPRYTSVSGYQYRAITTPQPWSPPSYLHSAAARTKCQQSVSLTPYRVCSRVCFHASAHVPDCCCHAYKAFTSKADQAPPLAPYVPFSGGTVSSRFVKSLLVGLPAYVCSILIASSRLPLADATQYAKLLCPLQIRLKLHTLCPRRPGGLIARQAPPLAPLLWRLAACSAPPRRVLPK